MSAHEHKGVVEMHEVEMHEVSTDAAVRTGAPR
jgi:hypothetical protein